MQRRLRTRASWRVTKRRRAASGVSMRQCMRLRTLLNVRSGCGTEYEIVTQLKSGRQRAAPSVSETAGARCFIRTRAVFIRSEYLTTTEPGSEEATVTAQGAEADAQGAPVSNGRIVAIDAGHQAKGNPDKEPVGPGSLTMKAKVASGTEGVSTKLPEYELTLSVSKKFKTDSGRERLSGRHDPRVQRCQLKQCGESGDRQQERRPIFVRITAIRWTTRRSTEHSPCARRRPTRTTAASRGKLLSFQEDHGLCLRGNRLQEPRVQETDSMSASTGVRYRFPLSRWALMSKPGRRPEDGTGYYQEYDCRGNCERN